MKKSLTLIKQTMLTLVLATGTPASAQETLVLHHFLSPQTQTHAAFIEPWAREIERKSGGKIKIEIYPSMTLGGKPPELYRQLRDGAADIVWTLIGYTPGVFPRSEVFELPSVHRGSAKATNLAIQSTFNLIADDYKDIKPLLVHVHAGNALHLANTIVKTPDDTIGLKIRTPSRTGAWMIEAWGAEPVGMPLPSLPQAMSKGVVEGALIPFEVVPPLNLHELTQHSVETENGGRFGTSVFLFAMNQARYDALSPDLQQLIDNHSGIAIAGAVGALWDSFEQAGKKAQRESGGTVTQINAAAKTAFDQHAKIVETRWLEEAGATGLDGATILQAAVAAVAAHSN